MIYFLNVLPVPDHTLFSELGSALLSAMKVNGCISEGLLEDTDDEGGGGGGGGGEGWAPLWMLLPGGLMRLLMLPLFR